MPQGRAHHRRHRRAPRRRNRRRLLGHAGGRRRTVYRFAPYCSAFFPGCGDLLASILLAGVLSGECAADALGQAVEFISLVSHKTQRLGTPTREGVVFENELYRLT